MKLTKIELKVGLQLIILGTKEIRNPSQNQNLACPIQTFNKNSLKGKEKKLIKFLVTDLWYDIAKNNENLISDGKTIPNKH